MSVTHFYELDIPQGRARNITIGWLFLALGALVLGGLMTLLIVLSRTPGIQDIIPWTDFFHTALVVHVDLTVLVWFLAFAGVLWSLNSRSRCAFCTQSALYLAVIGTFVIVLSPFLGAADPIMNNYVPVLQHSIYFIGLILLGCGFGVLVISSIFFSTPLGDLSTGSGVLRFGLMTGVFSAFVAIITLLFSYFEIPQAETGKRYYELLFWGAGHVLQFTHTQLMLVVWLWLASVAGVIPRITPRLALIVFFLGFIPVLIAPVLNYLYEISSIEYRLAFTRLMEYGGGIAALPIGIAVFLGLITNNRIIQKSSPEKIALIVSLVVFTAGGVIGFLIRGINVTIPAHYHGSIVGITLAYMGMTYYLLPRLGFNEPMSRLASWQPVVYGGGQLIHIFGLAWSGGYGVQRKTAGEAQGLDSLQETLGMAMMGAGGLIAIVGGLLFLIVVYYCIFGSKKIN